MILSVRDLVSGYGQSSVLSDVGFTIPEAEVVALLGRNGMGNTTLLRTVMGLLPARRGSIAFRGREITGMRPHLIARLGIGYVPQGREIFAAFTVEENLRLAALGQGRRGTEGEIYHLFPLLAERRRQRAGNLSGGQQQLLALARALVAGPELLLLDEPSEGVQPSIVAEIALLLGRVAKERRISMLLVEQNLELALAAAERCIVMENGRVAAEYASAELRNNPGLVQSHLAI